MQRMYLLLIKRHGKNMVLDGLQVMQVSMTQMMQGNGSVVLL